jgi:hypothetical protein
MTSMTHNPLAATVVLMGKVSKSFWRRQPKKRSDEDNQKLRNKLQVETKSNLKHTELFSSCCVLLAVNLCSSRMVRDKVSHPHKRGKIIYLYVLIFSSLSRNESRLIKSLVCLSVCVRMRMYVCVCVCVGVGGGLFPTNNF